MAENNLNDVYAGMEASRQAEAARAAGNPDLAKQELAKLAKSDDLPPVPGYQPVKPSEEKNPYRKHFWEIWKPAVPKEVSIPASAVPSENATGKSASVSKFPDKTVSSQPPTKAAA